MTLPLLLLLSATLRGPADIASLTQASDAVVRARVVSTVSAWGAGGPSGGVIYTQVTLAPTETLKGAPAAGLVVRVPGGAVGDLDQTVPGAARFHEGEDVVVFLRALAPHAGRDDPSSPPLFDVTRWALGKFVVAHGGRAARDRSGVTCVGCAAGEADELPVDELRARVRESAAR